MGQLESYALELRNMPIGVQQFSYVVGDSFFRKMESADIRAGKVSVELTAERKGDSFDLTFKVVGDVTIGCDRCLDDMPHHVDATYHTVVRYGEALNDDNDEEIIVPEKERAFDLSGIIYDTIALTVPMKHVHADGECNAAMLEKIREHSGAASGEAAEATDPRWDALKTLTEKQ